MLIHVVGSSKQTRSKRGNILKISSSFDLRCGLLVLAHLILRSPSPCSTALHSRVPSMASNRKTTFQPFQCLFAIMERYQSQACVAVKLSTILLKERHVIKIVPLQKTLRNQQSCESWWRIMKCPWNFLCVQSLHQQKHLCWRLLLNSTVKRKGTSYEHSKFHQNSPNFWNQ